MGSRYFPMIRCCIPATAFPCEPEILVSAISILRRIRVLYQMDNEHVCYCWRDKRVKELPSVQASSFSELCDHPSFLFINHYLKELPRSAQVVLVEALISKRLKLVVWMTISLLGDSGRDNRVCEPLHTSVHSEQSHGYGRFGGKACWRLS